MPPTLPGSLSRVTRAIPIQVIVPILAMILAQKILKLYLKRCNKKIRMRNEKEDHPISTVKNDLLVTIEVEINEPRATIDGDAARHDLRQWSVKLERKMIDLLNESEVMMAAKIVTIPTMDVEDKTILMMGAKNAVQTIDVKNVTIQTMVVESVITQTNEDEMENGTILTTDAKNAFLTIADESERILKMAVEDVKILKMVVASAKIQTMAVESAANQTIDDEMENEAIQRTDAKNETTLAMIDVENEMIQMTVVSSAMSMTIGGESDTIVPTTNHEGDGQIPRKNHVTKRIEKIEVQSDKSMIHAIEIRTTIAAAKIALMITKKSAKIHTIKNGIEEERNKNKKSAKTRMKKNCTRQK